MVSTSIALLIKSVGMIIFSSIIISLSWKGRSNWEPSEEDVPKGPQKVGGLISAVCICLMWSFLDDFSTLNIVINIAICSLIICVSSLFIYTLLITLFVYKTDSQLKNIIGGIVLKKKVRLQLKKNYTDSLTIKELFERSNYDADKIWTRFSRAISKICFLLCYLGLTSLGTISLSAASMAYFIKLNEPAAPMHVSEKKSIGIAIIQNGDVHYTREILEGFRDEVEKELQQTIYKPHFETVIGFPSESDSSKNKKVLDSLLSLFDTRPEYLVSIGTNVSENCYKQYFNKIPIIFIGVTDPIKSGLVKSFQPNEHRGNICGVQSGLSAMTYLNFFVKIFPNKKIGFIYNPTFHQDLYLKDDLLNAEKKVKKITIIPIETSNNFLTPEQLNMADIFWGRFAVSTQFQNFLKSSSKPFIGNSPLNIDRGALISMSVDDASIGKLAADHILIPNLLKSVSLSTIPIQAYDQPTIGINTEAARKFGITIDSSIISQADLVIK